MSMRLAQITDCHFTARSEQLLHGVDVGATLGKVIDLLEQWQPVQLLMTGDLSDRGDPASYRRLRKAVRNIASPINIIPGNHDQKHNLYRHFVGGQIRVLGTPSTASQARPGQTEFIDDEVGPGFRWFELHNNGGWNTGVLRTAESAMTLSG